MSIDEEHAGKEANCPKCGVKFTIPTVDQIQKQPDGKLCPNCGKRIDKGVKFCPSCGNPISIADKGKAKEVPVWGETKPKRKVERGERVTIKRKKTELSLSFKTKLPMDEVIAGAVKFFSSEYKVQSQGQSWIMFEPMYQHGSLSGGGLSLIIIGGLICLITLGFGFFLGVPLILWGIASIRAARLMATATINVAGKSTKDNTEVTIECSKRAKKIADQFQAFLE